MAKNGLVPFQWALDADGTLWLHLYEGPGTETQRVGKCTRGGRGELVLSGDRVSVQKGGRFERGLAVSVVRQWEFLGALAAQSEATKTLLLCRHSVVSDALWASRPLCPWAFSGENTGGGRHCLLQGIFLTQGSNLHHRAGRRIPDH